MTIIQLDDSLSNKIAAGEVIDRPASIVKELIENALDANSSRILIEIEEGGLQSIRVNDNGSGINANNVKKAFLRHATSKIKTDRDLFQIKTLGFRGEALPSIASVSYFHIKTSTGKEAGIELYLEGGKVVKENKTTARQGTDITVSNLFYNTPARLKYLKTVHTELGHISDIVNRLALAYPHVAFHCYHNKKKLLQTVGNGDVRQVIAAIYGRNVAMNMVEIKGKSVDYEIDGFATLPEITRASRQYMSIFVNGRFIRNYTLARAIQEGYYTLLPIHRYPIVVLNIQMDPQLVDVNVHPAKLEVRLSKEAELAQLITASIQDAFKQKTLIPEIKPDTRTKTRSEQMSFPLQDAEPKMVKEKINPTNYEKKNTKRNENSNSNKEMSSDESREITLPHISAKKEIEEKNNKEKDDLQRLPTMYPVGQMHGTYIVAQNDNGMYIIDQHAAQERIKYEYYKSKIKEENIHYQDLIVPLTIECTMQEMTMMKDHMDTLRAVGIHLENFGQQTFIIRSHPTWFPKGYEEETIREIVDYLLSHGRINTIELREEATIMMACKAAIKGNRHLRHDEMYALLQSLRQAEDPFTCPHGRPIIVHFSTRAIEKMFKRTM